MIHIDQSSWMSGAALPETRSVGRILSDSREIAALREKARQSAPFLNFATARKHPQSATAPALRRGIG